ncbi:fibroleukin-like [Watersipora subatra]|uniref:fibroleukin-like n=1 Tax=Watersipora subatra TaxID=2589382 RepID=UPI00355BD99E
MHLLTVLAALLSVVFASGSLLDNVSLEQQLFVLDQKINILYNSIKSQCPTYVDKRSYVSKPSKPVDITVANEVYKKLNQKLIDCKRWIEGKQVKDCQEYYDKGERNSGVYKIRPSNTTIHEFSIWCDFFDGHGWTVFQRRENGSVSFDMPWYAYKKGFGNLDGEYWLGNDKLHLLTQTNPILNIYLEVPEKAPAYGTWQEFYVGDELDKYKLSVNGAEYNGTLPEDLSHHDGAYFSTFDRFNGGWGDCAGFYGGGWWYIDANYCGYVHNSYSGMLWTGYAPRTTASIMRVTRD